MNKDDYRDEYYMAQAKLTSLAIYNESLKDEIKKLKKELESLKNKDAKCERVMTKQEVISEFNAEALTLDGFDEAIIGIAERISMNPIVAYSVQKIIYILVKEHNLEFKDAEEYFEYNILGAFMGVNTPIFIHKLEENAK